MRRSDPRIRQTLNQISESLEAAKDSTQASLFALSQNYINPCLTSLNTCLEASCAPCYAARDDRLRRNRHGRSMNRGRGRAELTFDFYSQWDDEEDGSAQGLLGGWGNDELDRLLAGSGAHDQPPGRHRAMSYGARGRRTSTLPKLDTDPTIVPTSSVFGFLERLPWKFGGKGLKYKPSAADLQENPGRRGFVAEEEPLVEESDEGGGAGGKGRNRSGTVGSVDTNTSLSSRGDIFPSEDEDDAVPLDDEFAMVLGRRTTNTTSDDQSSGRQRGAKRPGGSRTSTRTGSSKDTKGTRDSGRARSTSNGNLPNVAAQTEIRAPSMTDLKQEEERVRREEEAEIERKRHAAQTLALKRGLSSHEEEIKSPEDQAERFLPHPIHIPIQRREDSFNDTSIPHPRSNRTSISEEIPTSRPESTLDSPTSIQFSERRPSDDDF